MASSIQAGAALVSQTSHDTFQNPETLCREHFPSNVIDLLSPHLGYNMKDWVIKEDARLKAIPFIDEGVHLAFCEEKGELDIYLALRRDNGVSNQRFSYKKGVPTTHVNVNPVNQGSDAEKVIEGFAPLKKAIETYEKRIQANLHIF